MDTKSSGLSFHISLSLLYIIINHLQLDFDVSSSDWVEIRNCTSWVINAFEERDICQYVGVLACGEFVEYAAG